MKFPYKTYRSYLKERFGKPILKVPINGGFSCPNKVEGDACTFCDNRSFSPAALKSDDVVAQFLKVKNRSKRYSHFIPYLQPNTNTYGTVEELKSIYEPLLVLEGVVGFAIGTRPDALNDEIYDYLADINKRTYLSVELGLQSSNDKTLDRISRGHTFEAFAVAVKELAKRNIEVVAHLMAGLPDETIDDMVQSAIDVSRLPVRGVKIHQLMIIEDTEMADEYRKGAISVLSLEKYAQILATMLQYTRSDMHIHRFMADAKPEFGLIAPAWSAEKDPSVIYLQNYLVEHEIRQGEKFVI